MWDEPGFPRKGWSALGVNDLGKGEWQSCDVCGQQIRYVHALEHPSYWTEIAVGVDCAGHLTDDYAGCEAREKPLKLKAARKQREQKKREADRLDFITRPWNKSTKGYWLYKLRGYIFFAWRNTSGYTVIVKQDGGITGDKLGPFDTPVAAKTAAYEWICGAV